MQTRETEDWESQYDEHSERIPAQATDRTRAVMRARRQVTIPENVANALGVGESDEIEFTMHADGAVTLRGWTSVPTDQRWFWTPEWQAGEREADEQIARGETTYYDGAEDMLAAWERDR